MKRELPDDLARLGLYLEVAAGETLRRRQRRQAMANFIGAVSLAVPFALALAPALRGGGGGGDPAPPRGAGGGGGTSPGGVPWGGRSPPPAPPPALPPPAGFSPPRPQPISLDVQPPTNKFMVRHIPDEPLPPKK